MEQNITFIKPKDLNIIIGDNDIILRKGFIHLNEVIIDKEKSSKEFVDIIRKIKEEAKVKISTEDSAFDDLIQLNKMGFINKEMKSKALLITGSVIFDDVKKILGEIEIKKTEEILDREDILTLNEEKNKIKYLNIIEKAKNIFDCYDYVYYLDAFSNLTNLRAFNKVFIELDKSFTCAFYDNENIYITNVQPKETGCFECLEKHISTKFPRNIDYYKNLGSRIKDVSPSCSELLILLGIIKKDYENVINYGNTSLEGQVIHFYLPNFEYSYNTNRRHVACNCCAGINNVSFEEQNVKAVNLIKKVMKND